jgi:hypothetical protein
MAASNSSEVSLTLIQNVRQSIISVSKSAALFAPITKMVVSIGRYTVEMRLVDKAPFCKLNKVSIAHEVV